METKTTKIYCVFVSCPKDVNQQRTIVEKVCNRLTKDLGPLHNIELKCVHWQKEVVPVITGEDAQTVIDKQIGQNYDIYLGIMWSRLGNKRSNGLTPTEGEFEDALKRRKNTGSPVIQFYFKNIPYSPKDDVEKQQLSEVERFQRRAGERGVA